MIPYSVKDKRIIALLTILSGLIGLACMIVGLFAVQFDFEAFSNPVKVLTMPGVNANLMRWFMLLDMFGYYLLLLPIIFLIHRELEQTTAWAAVITASGFGYVLIGSIGAAALAVTWPSLMIRYEQASSAMKEVYTADFLMVTEFVAKGMWNYLEVFLAGVWWLGSALFIKSRSLKVTTIVLGASCMLDGVGELLQLPILAELGLNVYLLLAIVWPIWVGIALWKGKL
jgi:hypothetical protein